MPDYQRLADYLAACPQERLTLTFAQLEGEILHDTLPWGAKVQRSWWRNIASNYRRQSRTWLDIGWRVEAVDLYAATVTFARASNPLTSSTD